MAGPFLGALADIQRSRKKWLIGSALTGACATTGLVIATPQTVVVSSIIFFVASLCFTISLTFYHSFLNALSTPDDIGRVSGFGWAVGYIGGGLCLALNLLMIEHPSWFHLPGGDISVRLTFLTVGIWWILFTIPFLVWVKEPAGLTESPRRLPGLCRAAGGKVLASLRAAGHFRKNLFLFLISYLLYNDAIETIIVVAGIFAAQELGMRSGEIVGCFLMIQFVAFFGALGFGRLADRWSNKKALQASLGVWALILVWAMVMTRRSEFWAAGVIIALVLGGSQSVSRSLFGKMVPRGEEAQYYGFWGLSGKIAAAAGPLIFGLVHHFSGNIRLALMALLVLLATGQVLLSFVEEYDKNAPC